MQDNNELEVTTPAEDVYKEDELDRFLAHTSTSNKSFTVRDRTGLRLSFFGLLPITTGDNGEPRIWGGSIILNSAELGERRKKSYENVMRSCRVSEGRF